MDEIGLSISKFMAVCGVFLSNLDIHGWNKLVAQLLFEFKNEKCNDGEVM